MNRKKLDVSQRVSAIIEHYSLTISSLEKLINVSNNSIGTAIRRGADFKSEVLNKILNSFPEIDPTWLLTGDGKMFDDIEGELVVNPIKGYSDSLIELPYIPLSARATFAESFVDLLHDPGETYSVYKQEDYDYTSAQILEINGDSMEPTLISKEKVLIKELCDSKWEYFTGLAAIAFKNMFVVKRITSNFDGILTLSSDNPMGGTFKVKIDDVRIIYTIEHSIYRPIK